MSLTSICVFCGSRIGKNSAYRQAAENLGQVFAKKGIRLVYGAGNVGLMGVIADACLEKSGEVIGVIPHFLRKWEVCHENLTKLVLVDTLFERKVKMAELSQGVIALPGGYGTLDELFEIVTLVQLRQIHQPIGVLNVNGYFDHLIKQFHYLHEEGFIGDFHHNLIQISDNLEVLLEKMNAWLEANPSGAWVDPGKWDERPTNE